MKRFAAISAQRPSTSWPARLAEHAARIQVVSGPRQVGKTTLVQQVAGRDRRPGHYASADEPTLRGAAWIAQQWEAAARLATARSAGAVLALDEIQKVAGWSESVKRLWDEDTRARRCRSRWCCWARRRCSSSAG